MEELFEIRRWVPITNSTTPLVILNKTEVSQFGEPLMVESHPNFLTNFFGCYGC